MFKLLGIDFKLNLLFLLILLLFSLSGFFVTSVIIFALVIVHELAHSFVAIKEGVRVDQIELLPFGGVVKFRDLIQLKPEVEIKVALAGPILNFILAFVALILFRYELIFDYWAYFFIEVNLTIALFNLIPALPLDGGRILRAKLTFKMGYKRATYKALQISKLIVFFFFFVALLGIYYGYYNIFLLMIAFFIYYRVLKEGRYTYYVLMQYIAQKKGELLKERVLRVEHLITYADTSLTKIIDELVPNRFHIIVVVDDNFEVLGRVSEDRFIDILVKDGIEAKVKDLL
ncbi:M50 family metallopeptidase [Halonatronum saccharophilum]|uniref:M50 family metallopeptidase n=1 Tax=Halonatronum saccharophilum TaxID=150060 RepID=UPI000483B73F|nr:M50 family metallopeptidase [Halonatronum saccharophilum]